MKNTFLILTLLIFILTACQVSTPDPAVIQAAVVLTQAAMPSTTPVKLSDTPIPQSTFTISPTHTPTSTETPMGPVSFTYEGVTLNCTCIGCICITDQPSFTVRLTIDAQGYVTGTFEKYHPNFPAFKLEGTKTSILGSVKDDTKEGNFMEFNGSLNKSLKTLNATLSFRGPAGTGKRELLFTRK